MTPASTPSATLPADLGDVRRKLEELGRDGRVDDLIELVLALLVQMRDSNTALSVRLANALRELYGRKSQKISADQLALMFEAAGQQVAKSDTPESTPEPPPDASATPDAEGTVAQPPDPPKPARGRGGRSPLPKDLPRLTRIVPVAEEDRICSNCGAEKVFIGYRTSPILEFVPAHFQVIEEQCEKRACPSCPEEGVVTATSEKVMDRGRPGPGLLAHIVVSKFQDAMPLYRQAQYYERSGLWIAPSTLGDWNAFALDVVAPIAERIFELVVSSSYLNVDDTGLRVLDRDHPNGVKRGHIWDFVGHIEPGVKLVAFRYTPDWAATGPAALLKGFAGDLQGDGYAGFQAMLDDDGKPIVPDSRRLGCGMHIRAKFEKAAKNGDLRGAVALAHFKAIYRIEAACKEDKLSADARAKRREDVSLPIVDELYKWIREIHPGLVPKTPLYEATHYAITQEQLWRRCFADGRFEIDNGEAERNLRWISVGRKNYLFAGSDKGAERLAVGYTVVGSCRINGVNPLCWMTDVIEKLQAGWPASRLDELLPHNWARAHAAEAAAANSAPPPPTPAPADPVAAAG